MARACGSYPQCPRFESVRRHQKESETSEEEVFFYAQLSAKALEALDNKEQQGLRNESILDFIIFLIFGGRILPLQGEYKLIG